MMAADMAVLNRTTGRNSMKGIILVLWLIVIAGCATVTRGVEEVFVVESDPVGAKVMLLYDDPVILYTEDKANHHGGFDGGYDQSQMQESVMLEKLEGVTPATFKISRRGAFTVTIEKEGYQPVSARVETQMATAGGAALAGNICLGGCLGAAIDVGIGSHIGACTE